MAAREGRDSSISTDVPRLAVRSVQEPLNLHI